MSLKGNCYDNAAMDSFFHSLKAEWTNHFNYESRSQAKSGIFEYVEMFYSTKHRHSYTNQLAPLQFEELHAKAE